MYKSATRFGYTQPPSYLRFCIQPDGGYIQPKHVANLLLVYLLIPRSTVLLEKLTGSQLVKKFPAFYGTRRFITAFTSARHLSLLSASTSQSTTPHPTSWRSILTLSSHLRLGLPSGLFPSGFPTKTLYTPTLRICNTYCFSTVKWLRERAPMSRYKQIACLVKVQSSSSRTVSFSLTV